ncbi:CapA family protein [Streptomyces meridianus]|uniref:CapA family protein n=1 Tax=Streptomyces meridianus TaxID=2938945 RepID=A0ABT0XC65_9ACTN|nr:CapA family protein [Streptomyces meridianus]MCM2580117.1 CapA family protein [Streptomyces meridianus]
MAMRSGISVGAAVALLALVAGCSSPPDGQRSGSATGAAAKRAAGRTGDSAAGRFTLIASGDVLPHDSVIRQAHQDAQGAEPDHDFRPMLAGVKPIVSKADLALCHMETVYGPEGGPFTGYPMFVSPPQVAEALADTGYDGCSTASNHTLDAGTAGVERTLGALDKAGVRHAGSARSADEADRPVLLRAGPATVGHLSYTYGTNGIPVPEDRPWTVNLIDEKRIVADARAARKAGADVVVVSLHWGTEWQQAPDEQQLSLARLLTAARSGGGPAIDLILGTHNHVPQPYEKVNGTWVVYGMGDQLAGSMINHAGAHDPRGDQGSLARFTFAGPEHEGGRWTVEKAEFIPQIADQGPPIRVVAPGGGSGGRSSDVRAVREAVLSRGADKDGLVMGR